MARILTDGFEMGDALGWTFSAGGASTTIARSGSYCGYISGTGNATGVRYFTALGEGHYRIGLCNNGAGYSVHCDLRNGGTSVIVITLTGGSFWTATCNGTTLTGTTIISNGTWYLFEIYLKLAASGEFTIVCEGNDSQTKTGDTRTSGKTTVDNILIQNGNNGNSRIGIDDVAINDTTGGVDDSWCGDGHIVALTPNGNGANNQFTGSDGNSTDNYLLVDETPYNADTDYVEDDTVGHIDDYDMVSIAAFLPGQVVTRVWTEVRARILSADGSQLGLGLTSGGVESTITNVTPATGYGRHVSADIKTNPSGGAWSESAINALQARIKVV